VKGVLRHLTPQRQEIAMTLDLTDPRLDLTIDDLMTISVALAIARVHVDDVDRRRFRELSAKLAAILTQTQEYADGRHAASNL
jgi:hypothetical protein